MLCNFFLRSFAALVPCSVLMLNYQLENLSANRLEPGIRDGPKQESPAIRPRSALWRRAGPREDIKSNDRGRGPLRNWKRLVGRSRQTWLRGVTSHRPP